MASKKPAVSRSAKPAPKLVPKSEAQPAPQPAPQRAPQPATGKNLWALPIVMLMLVVGAAALLMAVRESSNAPQAATATMAPDMRASVATGGTGSRTAVASSAVPAASRAADSTSSPAKPADASSADSPKPVSLTGCLQQTDRGFVLKNTEGADAPKSRSWKSGFFKRSSVSIDLSDKGGSAALGKHVGQRVRVTGALVERDMKVLSLRPISASCE